MHNIWIILVTVVVGVAGFAGCTRDAVATEETTTSEANTVASGVSAGVWQDGIYRSESAALAFTLPEGWEPIDTPAQEPTDDQIITETIAHHPDTGSRIAIIYENLALLAEGKSYTEYTAEDYQTDVQTSLDDLDPGYTVEQMDDISIAGEAYQVTSAILDDADSRMYFFTRKMEQYMLNIVITLAGDDTLDDSLACFS